MDWAKKAKAIMRSELAKQDIDYIELSKRLDNIGVKNTQMNLANKINRGTFNFIFALQVFKVLGLHKINLEDM